MSVTLHSALCLAILMFSFPDRAFKRHRARFTNGLLLIGQNRCHRTDARNHPAVWRVAVRLSPPESMPSTSLVEATKIERANVTEKFPLLRLTANIESASTAVYNLRYYL
jgi:hypothetical protein